jgi:hypothetical protein
MPEATTIVSPVSQRANYYRATTLAELVHVYIDNVSHCDLREKDSFPDNNIFGWDKAISQGVKKGPLAEFRYDIDAATALPHTDDQLKKDLDEVLKTLNLVRLVCIGTLTSRQQSLLGQFEKLLEKGGQGVSEGAVRLRKIYEYLQHQSFFSRFTYLLEEYQTGAQHDRSRLGAGEIRRLFDEKPLPVIPPLKDADSLRRDLISPKLQILAQRKEVQILSRGKDIPASQSGGMVRELLVSSGDNQSALSVHRLTVLKPWSLHTILSGRRICTAYLYSADDPLAPSDVAIKQKLLLVEYGPRTWRRLWLHRPQTIHSCSSLAQFQMILDNIVDRALPKKN